KLADDWMALDDAALAGKDAARCLDEGDADAAARACAVAELLALESAPRVAQNAIQVHGALGIAWECDMHLYLKRVRHIAAMLDGGRRREVLLERLWEAGGAGQAVPAR
ncbi:acyl-CoA dehydrogenase family protein, partial [Bordetella petrii]|uniref:acyl-CoA dehydrogenase family protein n=1 Tax=Bordetella petrii TaxID=94624 RepID=UPI0022A67984